MEPFRNRPDSGFQTDRIPDLDGQTGWPSPGLGLGLERTGLPVFSVCSAGMQAYLPPQDINSYKPLPLHLGTVGMRHFLLTMRHRLEARGKRIPSVPSSLGEEASLIHLSMLFCLPLPHSCLPATPPPLHETTHHT